MELNSRCLGSAFFGVGSILLDIWYRFEFKYSIIIDRSNRFIEIMLDKVFREIEK